MMYYDRDGQPMSFEQWIAVSERPFEEYRRVAWAEIGDVHVSTVWLGLDHNWSGQGPPIIFETMVFGGEMDGEQQRYATEAEAIAGHRELCRLVRLDVEVSQ